MSARLASRLGPALLALSGCNEERSQEPDLIELPFFGEVRVCRDERDWALEGASASLRFFVGEVDRDDRWSPPLAESVPLANGGVLASSVITISEGFAYLTCYLQLEPAAEGWRPVEVGLYGSSCVGFSWLDGLRGRVLVDSGNAERTLCRIELASTGPASSTFHGDILVDPAKRSVGLRNTILSWPGAPTLR